jgi:hypothetical protein
MLLLLKVVQAAQMLHRYITSASLIGRIVIKIGYA